MPEEIRPGRSDARGFIHLGRTGPTAFEALGDALSDGVGIVNEFVEKKEKKDLEEATNILSSPLLTPEEAAELEQTSRSPLIRMKAKNARGGLMVEEQIATFEDTISNTKDPIEARAKLKEFQSSLMEGVDDPAVRAGIRERFALHAPRMLGEASKRRLVAQEIEEQLIVSTDLQAGLSRGPIGFTEILVDHAEGSALAGKDMNAFHERAAQALQNAWRSGDDGLESNPDAPRILETIDAVLQHGGIVDEKQRSHYIGLRDAIEADEERRRGDPAVALDAANKAAYLARFKAAEKWRLRNPNAPFPADQAQALIDDAPTAAEARAAAAFATDALTDPRLPGVVGTKEHTQARALFEKSLSPEEGFALSTEHTKAMENFDAAVRALPKSLKDDEIELRRVLGEVSKNAKAQAIASVVQEEKETEAFNLDLGQKIAFHEAAKAKGDPVAVQKTKAAMDFTLEQRATQLRQAHRKTINDILVRSGAPPLTVDTLP